MYRRCPRWIATLVVMGGLLTMGIPVAPVTASSPTVLAPSAVPIDVSATAAGHAVAAAAQIRLRALVPRASTAAPPLGVWTDAAGVLVAPVGTIFEHRPWVAADGRAGTILVPTTLRSPIRAGSAVSGRRMAGPSAAAPVWTWVAQACFSRSSDVWSWLDHCYQLYEWSGTDGWDYWQLLRYGTAGANVPWALHGASIGSYPTTASAAQQWVQWDPLGDQTGPCQVVTIQITVPSLGIAWPVDRCDTWTIAKGAVGGTYSLAWSGPGTHGQRGLAYVLATRVPHGRFAQWALPGGSYGSPF